ncbi:MAG: helix-hairpin-helix domain-containing protein [Planctomycetes bacterium]|nr:helix-hairpin-helix domain-containing protein [Planctomycetota bacterium]
MQPPNLNNQTNTPPVPEFVILSKAKNLLKTTNNTPPTQKNKGMTLLMTLMVLIVLATVIVQFQVDSALYERTTSYRLEKEKCRYAAESGLIIAIHFIKETLRQHKGRFPTSLSLTSGSSVWTTIPSDPNEILEMDNSPQWTHSGSDTPSFVLMRDHIQIGLSDVEIEIQDENAKWPVLWHMPGNSPFSAKRDWAHLQKGFNKFAASAGVNATDTRTALNMMDNTGKRFRMPAAEFIVNLTSNARTSRRIIYRHIGYTKKREEAIQRRDQMKLFGRDFKDKLINDINVAALNENLPDKSASLSDYLGFWGHNRININTASPEILKGAFLPLGLNDKKVQMIVDYRKNKPFNHTNDLSLIKELGSNLVARMRPLCVVGPDTFTTKITARIGRTQYQIFASFYQDQGKLVHMALITN